MFSRQKITSKSNAGRRHENALFPSLKNLLPTSEKPYQSYTAPAFVHSFEHTPVYAALPGIQTKLSVNTPGDKYEQQADAMADRVMTMTEPQTVQRKCDQCKEKEEKQVQRKPLAQGIDTQSGNLVTPALNNQISASKGTGKCMDSDTHSFMSNRFGINFSQVKIHADNEAEQMSSALSATAFTAGNDIYFNQGAYRPQSSAGKHLLAHELTHVVQQAGNAMQVQRQLIPEKDSPVPLAGPYTGINPFPNAPLPPPVPLKQPPSQQKEQTKAPKETKEPAKCEEFPGGATDCEVDETTGTPTGKVTHHVDETNHCTRPCVEAHEQVHVKQLKKYCPELRACYLDADKGKRPVMDCAKMAIFGNNVRECEAYTVSVPCMEQRLKKAPECKSEVNKAYGARKLASERCFKDKNCGA